MDRLQNTLFQEELYLKQIPPVDLPEEINEEMMIIINAIESSEYDFSLRRFIFNYCFFSLLLIAIFPQLGIKLTSVDISSILNILGPFKHLLSGAFFSATISSSVIIFKMNLSDMKDLYAKKRKEIYLTMLCSILTFAIFGTEISLINIILWIIGAMFGLNFGLKLGIQYLEESKK